MVLIVVENHHTMQINLPTGASFEARKLQGQELIKLAERVENGEGGLGIERILGSCFTSLTKEGPYKPVGVGLDFFQVCSGDLYVGLLQLRQFSVPFGDLYYFKVKCEDCPERFEVMVRIPKLLERNVRKLSDENFAIFASSNRFEDVITIGKTLRRVVYELGMPAHNARLLALMKRLKRRMPTVVETIASQIVELEGIKAVGPDKKIEISAVHRALSVADADELELLRARMDHADCGLDGEIDMRCTSCGAAQQHELPLQRTFFRQPKSVLLENGLLKPAKATDEEGEDASGS